MKKVMLLMSLFIMVGCTQVDSNQESKSDLYNAVNIDSVSDTINNLSEVLSTEFHYAGDTDIANRTFDLYNDGGSFAVFSEGNTVKMIFFESDNYDELMEDFKDDATAITINDGTALVFDAKLVEDVKTDVLKNK